MAVLFVLITGIATALFFEVQSCPLDHFRENSTSLCKRCTICDPGHGVKIDCLEKSDTVCRTCQEGEYSEEEWDKRVCVKCKNCAAFLRITLKSCSLSNDSVCGECLTGFQPGDSEECINPAEEGPEFKPNFGDENWTGTVQKLNMENDIIKEKFKLIQIISLLSLCMVTMLLSITGVIVIRTRHKKYLCGLSKPQHDEENLIRQESHPGKDSDHPCI